MNTAIFVELGWHVEKHANGATVSPYNPRGISYTAYERKDGLWEVWTRYPSRNSERMTLKAESVVSAIIEADKAEERSLYELYHATERFI